MSNIKNAVPVQHFPTQVGINPLVSIIVNVYNHEKFLEENLYGILNQKCNFSFEILLGEDGSKDNSREICKIFAKNYPKIIRLFLHDRQNVIFINNSPTGRFNLLYSLSQANGKYVALCPGDDYWIDPNKLQSQVDFLEDNQKYSMCCHSVKIIETGENVSIYKPFRPFIQDATFKDILNTHFIPTLSLVFRKSFLPSPIPSWYSKPISGDIPLELILADRGPCRYIEKQMGVYRHHHGGVTKNKARKKNWLKYRILLYTLVNNGLDKKYSRDIFFKINSLSIKRIMFLIKNILKKGNSIALREDLISYFKYLITK